MPQVRFIKTRIEPMHLKHYSLTLRIYNNKLDFFAPDEEDVIILRTGTEKNVNTQKTAIMKVLKALGYEILKQGGTYDKD